MIKQVAFIMLLTISNRLCAQQADAAESFVPKGYEVLQADTADINGDGRMDLVLLLQVVDVDGSAISSENLTDSANVNTRSVILLVGRPNGKLKLAARSDVVIFDDACCTGGTGPDGSAFEGISCSIGYFTIQYFYHGGGEHLERNYVFNYSKKLDDWVLIKIETDEVSDTPTDSGGYDDEKNEVKTAGDFGLIRFSNFKRPYGY